MEAVAGDKGQREPMPTFFVKFKVVPTEHNPQCDVVQGAFACCLVLAEGESAAYSKASFYVEKDEWRITQADCAVVVEEIQFENDDTWLAQFHAARRQGIAIIYTGWARDGRTKAGPMPLEPLRQFDLNRYIGYQKKLNRKGRCLHYDSGVRCGATIKAHSIQEGGQLSLIAREGHVYAPSRNIGTLKKNDGRLILERYGIGKLSTFPGFCGKHDSHLFAPIDTQPLLPTEEQVLLYAYRSICRELFVKENALELISSQLASLPETSSRRGFFEAMRNGTSVGLTNLREHKSELDESLKSAHHTNIEYVLFASRQQPILAFSGLFYPEFDFLGRRLQNLADHERNLDLLTFCSAPMAEGWGFLFSWHRSSTQTCRAFMSSLATLIHESASGGADAMFRLVVSNCENLAVSPAWWERLAEEQQVAVTGCLSHGADVLSPTSPDYLTRGVEGICKWEFDSVYTTPERKPSR